MSFEIKYYMVRSGNGFFMRFDKGTNSPLMSSSRVDATEFAEVDDALEVARQLLEAGLVAHIVPYGEDDAEPAAQDAKE